MAFLVEQGYALRDLTDYEDGVTLDQMALFLREAQRFAIERERRAVQGMTIALASLFNSDLLSQYMKDTEAATRELSPQAQPTSTAAVARSIRQLNKLRTLME